MARPMTYTQFIKLLDEWDIPTKDNSRGGKKWYNHNRNHKGKWGDVNGSMNHHTGGDDNAAGESVLWNGYNGLPGPLCHGGIKQDGRVLLNGWGRCNHAGLGDDDVFDRVIAEDYSGVLKPNEANVDGNRRFYGWEWMYDGLSNPETAYPKMYRTAVRLNAAICTHHNWKAESCTAHGEWQPGKWDPGYRKGKLFDVVRFRNHVEQAIKEGPNPKKPLPQRPAPEKPKPNPTTPNSVTVKNGDTLWGLAEKHLGDGRRWIEFVAKNQKLIVLEPGVTLIIPKK